MRRRLWTGSLASAGLLLTQCSQAPKPPPAPPPPPPPPLVVINLAGGADQNPDLNGAASPVAVRIYELTATSKFERADVYALIDHDQQTLGTDDAASQEIVIAPSETQSLKIQPKPGVIAVGLAVLYRDIDHAQWRVTAPVASNGETKLKAKIGSHTITLNADP